MRNIYPPNNTHNIEWDLEMHFNDIMFVDPNNHNLGGKSIDISISQHKHLGRVTYWNGMLQTCTCIKRQNGYFQNQARGHIPSSASILGRVITVREKIVIV